MSFHMKFFILVVLVVGLAFCDDDEDKESDNGLPPIVTIILAATSSSLEIFMGMAIGMFLSHPYIGVLSDGSIRRAIGKMWVYIFTPLFMVRSFGSALDLEMAVDIWILPVWGTFQLLLGYIIAELCFPLGIFRCVKSSFRRVKKMITKKNGDLDSKEEGEEEGETNDRSEILSQQREEEIQRVNRTIYVLASSIPNSTFLVIVYVSSFYSVKKDRDLAVTFISLYSIPLFVFFYGYIFNYMKYVRPKEKVETNDENPDLSNSDHSDKSSNEESDNSENISNHSEDEDVEGSTEEDGDDGEEEEEGGENIIDSEENEETKIGHDETTSDVEVSPKNGDTVINLEDDEYVESENGSDHNDDDEEIRRRKKPEGENNDIDSNEDEKSESENEENEEKKKKGILKVLSYCNFCTKIIFNPVLVGIFIGVILAIIPGAKGFVFEDEPPVFVALTNIMNKMANCVLGLSLIIVGANLGAVMFPVEKKDDPEKNERTRNDIERNEKKKIDVNKDDEEHEEGGEPIKSSEGEDKEGENEEEEESTKEQNEIFVKAKKYLSVTISCCWNTFKLKNANPCLLLKTLFIKLIFIPILSFGFVAAFILSVGPYVIKEEYRAMIYLVLLVEGTVPLMLSLNMVAAMFDFGVSVLSEVMLVQYLVAPFTMGVFTTGFLYFICSIEKCTIL